MTFCIPIQPYLKLGVVVQTDLAPVALALLAL